MERLRKTWRGAVVSSQGFSVRMSSRTTILYKDRDGSVNISCEPMYGDGLCVEVFSESIPDTRDRPRRLVMENVGRAFMHAGWTLLPR